MEHNIINKEEVEEHSVQKYRFKVIGSNLADIQDSLHVEEQYPDDNSLIADVKPIFEEISQVARLEEGQNQFIEELLRKTDELSSNVIKLQIQIEKQEQDFNNRLSDEVTRERENAYKEGHQKAKEESEVLVQEMKSRYLKSISSLDELYKKMEVVFAKLEVDISSTAFEIAKEVIKKEVKDSSASIAISLSKELLKDIKDATKVELRVNPKDLEALREVYPEDEKIKVTADDSITLGGVVILSDVGNLDGNLAMRLEKVKYLIQES